MAQGFLAHQGSNQARIELLGFRVTVHPVIEIHSNLEQFVELGVKHGEQIIYVRLTEQDNLDIEGNRFRLQRDGTDQAHQLSQRFNADFLCLQCALQTFPGKWLHQHLVCIHHQIATVCTMQCTGADHGEISNQCTQFRPVFDPPYEIVVARVVFINNRRTIVLFMCNEGIDAVALIHLHPGISLWKL